MRKQSSHSVALQAWLCMSVMALIPNLSWSAEWWLTPSVDAGWEYNDNILGAAVSHPTVHGVSVSPKIDLGVQSEILSVSSSAYFVRKNYSGISELDQDNEYYTFSSKYMTERSTWQLDANLSHDSFQSDKSYDPDAALLPLQHKRKTSGISPSWTWMMTDRAQLQVGYQSGFVSYVDRGNSNLYDYDSRTVTTKLSNQLSAQDQIFVELDYSEFDVPENSFKSKTHNVLGGISHAFSDSFHVTLSAGGRKTLSDGTVKQCAVEQMYYISYGGRFYGPFTRCLQVIDVAVSQRESGLLFNAKVEKQFEVTRLSATLSRSLTPNGSGTPVETDSLDFQTTHPFTALLTGSFYVRVYDIHSETGKITGSDRTFYQVGTRLGWNWTREWSVETLYLYNHLKRINDSQAATGNALLVTLQYRGTKMSLSR